MPHSDQSVQNARDAFLSAGSLVMGDDVRNVWARVVVDASIVLTKAFQAQWVSFDHPDVPIGARYEAVVK